MFVAFFGLLLLIPIGLIRPSLDAIRPKSFFGEVAIQVVATSSAFFFI